MTERTHATEKVTRTKKQGANLKSIQQDCNFLIKMCLCIKPLQALARVLDGKQVLFWFSPFVLKLRQWRVFTAAMFGDSESFLHCGQRLETNFYMRENFNHYHNPIHEV